MKLPEKAECKGIGAPCVKFAHALFSNKKLPEEYAAEKNSHRYFLCDGLWAADKLIERKIKIRMVIFCAEAINDEKDAEKIRRLCEVAREAVAVSEKVCDKISDRDGAERAFIIAELPKITLSDIELKDNMTAIILDGQEQPGNIGAILRSLDAAGGEFAVYTNKRVKMTHSRLIRSSLGAAFCLPFIEAEQDELIEWLGKNNFKAVVTDLTATKDYYNVDYNGRIAIVAGNEYLGISPVWRTLPFAEPIIIPMLGSVESLNVGFASTLVAYECSLRQKHIFER